MSTYPSTADLLASLCLPIFARADFITYCKAGGDVEQVGNGRRCPRDSLRSSSGLGENMGRILVLATRNAKKCREIEEILGDLGLALGDLSQYAGAPEVVEDGVTFEANARKK